MQANVGHRPKDPIGERRHQEDQQPKGEDVAINGEIFLRGALVDDAYGTVHDDQARDATQIHDDKRRNQQRHKAPRCQSSLDTEAGPQIFHVAGKLVMVDNAQSRKHRHNQ